MAALADLQEKRVLILLIVGGVLLPCALYAFANIHADYKNILVWKKNNSEAPTVLARQPDEASGNKTVEAYHQQHWHGVNKTIVAYGPPVWLDIKSLNDMLSRQCIYRNCLITRDTTHLEKQDAILYTLTDAPSLPREPPIKPWERNIDQVWIFFWLEPPPHHGGLYRTAPWRNAVNWTMSYTSDSDIIFPYGSVKRRTIPPLKDYHAIFQRKTSMVAWAVSHCNVQSLRERYVSKLREEGITVDIFGKCKGGNVTQANLKIPQDELKNLLENKYKFYFGFENSFCKDYITEKFYKYFSYDIVVVVRGAGNYSNLVPNDAVINTAYFNSVKDLAAYLKNVAANETLYTEYLKSKDRFDSSPDFLHTEAVCSICEKLNKLEQNRRVYTDLVKKIHEGTCFNPKDLL